MSKGRVTHRGIFIWLCILAAAFHARAVQAQSADRTSVSGDFAVLGANLALGALSAGLGAWLSDRSFSDAFARGALGGAIGYAGKRIVVTEWPFGPALGRSVAAAGNSIITSAYRGSRLLDSLQIPVGFMRLTFPTNRPALPNVELNLRGLAATLFAATQPDLSLDWGRSLAALTPVFDAQRSRIRSNDRFVDGLAIASVVLLDGSPLGQSDRVFRHEMVHILQHDFMDMVWDRPAETWARQQIPWAGYVPRFIFAGVLVPYVVGGIDAIGRGDGVFRSAKEEEATWFERKRQD